MTVLNAKILYKNFRDAVSRVKFPVESKSELKIEEQNEEKPGNKNKQKKLVFKIKIDIYSDSGNRFCGKFYVDFMSSVFSNFFFVLIQ